MFSGPSSSAYRASAMKTILVVCTGNICRSPMAAAIMRDRLAAQGLTDQIQVLSAGVWAEDGHSASQNAISVLGERTIDLSSHRSQPITPALLDQASIILVMEEAHRRSLFHFAPRHLGKVFLLTEMTGGHEDVADPFGGNLQDYVQTANLLEKLIDAGLPTILQRLQVKR